MSSTYTPFSMALAAGGLNCAGYQEQVTLNILWQQTTYLKFVCYIFMPLYILLYIIDNFYHFRRYISLMSVENANLCVRKQTNITIELSNFPVSVLADPSKTTLSFVVELSAFSTQSRGRRNFIRLYTNHVSQRFILPQKVCVHRKEPWRLL